MHRDSRVVILILNGLFFFNVLCFQGIKSEHIVLDMCSSPGSKTKQVTEEMLRDANGDVPKGVLVSNEMNPSRCDRLASNRIR